MSTNELILLGKRIAELRCAKGLTQEGLSEICGVSSRHISEIERARTNPTFEALMAIAKALGLSLVALLDFRHLQAPADIYDEVEEMLKSLPQDKLVLAYRLLKIIVT